MPFTLQLVYIHLCSYKYHSLRMYETQIHYEEHLPFDCLQYARMEGKGVGFLTTFCGTDDIHILSLELQSTYRKKFRTETIHSHAMIKTGTSLKASVFNHISESLGLRLQQPILSMGLFFMGPWRPFHPTEKTGGKGFTSHPLNCFWKQGLLMQHCLWSWLQAGVCLNNSDRRPTSVFHYTPSTSGMKVQQVFQECITSIWNLVASSSSLHCSHTASSPDLSFFWREWVWLVRLV